MITAYNLHGNVLPDFPLAVGDSLTVSPALLDIDSDGDLELAGATLAGTVYVWDFPSRADASPRWPQIYGTPENNNRQFGDGGGGGNVAANLLPAEAVYNWPNPNIEDYTFIRYRLSQEADVTIRIYDLAGDLVKELKGSGLAQTDNEVRWDLTEVQTGVYLGRVEAHSGSQTEVQVIKIAVVK
jgi:hypothetical protein